MACHPPNPTVPATVDNTRQPPPDQTAPGSDAPASAGVSAADRAVMRARLAAMSVPRDSDTPRLAALRAILRDESLMAHVTANVERWPPLSDEQRETLGALLNRAASRAAGRTGTRADSRSRRRAA